MKVVVPMWKIRLSVTVGFVFMHSIGYYDTISTLDSTYCFHILASRPTAMEYIRLRWVNQHTPDSKVYYVAHLGHDVPRWTPCWPHEPCYQWQDVPWNHFVISNQGNIVMIPPPILRIFSRFKHPQRNHSVHDSGVQLYSRDNLPRNRILNKELETKPFYFVMFSMQLLSQDFCVYQILELQLRDDRICFGWKGKIVQVLGLAS